MKKITYILGLLAVAPLFGSCDNHDIPVDGDNSVGNDGFNDNTPRVVLKISPVNTDMSATADVKEKIETLRIVMINQTADNEDLYVEINRLIEFGSGDAVESDGSQSGEGSNTPVVQTGGKDASTFRYVFTRPVVPGKKRFYLIANERSVKEIHFEGQQNLPEGITDGMSLTDFLSHYFSNEIPGFNDPDYKNGEGDPSGIEFETLMNSIYFGRAYEVSENNIYLPYTAYYDGYTIAAAGDHDSKDQFIDADMYLVPVATKFKFRFENYRMNPVLIEEIELGGIAQCSFAMAKVNEPDYMKTLYEEEYYWIDWLKEVSSLSQRYPDEDSNMEFNQMWGWIDNYNIPAVAYSEAGQGIAEDDNNNVGTDTPSKPESEPILGKTVIFSSSKKYVDAAQLPEGSNIPQPGIWESGYFYLPESRFMVPVLNETQTDYLKDSEGNIVRKQEYYISAKLKDEKADIEDQYADFTDNQIGNLKSLFRNTCTVITITMYDWNQVGAYADVEPWNPHENTGFLQEWVENN